MSVSRSARPPWSNPTTVGLILVSIFSWVGYATGGSSREGVGWRTVSGVVLALGFVFLIVSARRVVLLRPTSSVQELWIALVGGLWTLNLYISGFAILYLSFGGGTSNFLAGPDAGHRLGRLDAVYFTMTTFTTTGYGDWHPVSESARAVVLAQMVTGFIVVSVLLALVVSALVSRTHGGGAKPEKKR